MPKVLNYSGKPPWRGSLLRNTFIGAAAFPVWMISMIVGGFGNSIRWTVYPVVLVNDVGNNYGWWPVQKPNPLLFFACLLYWAILGGLAGLCLPPLIRWIWFSLLPRRAEPVENPHRD